MPDLKIIPVRIFGDNYVWCIIHSKHQQCAIVDPGDAVPIIKFLEEQQLAPCAIFVTHFHWDHCGGLSGLLERYPNTPVYGSAHEASKALDHPVRDGDEINLPSIETEFHVLEVPGHTQDGIAFCGQRMAFTGDTLFACGCGRLFGGTPDQLYHSLQRLAELPDDTLIYCGHEYTESNSRFALKVESDNQALQERYIHVKKQRAQGEPTVPSDLATERQTNPFLRCDEKTVIRAVENHEGRRMTNPIEVFTALRHWKDQS